MSAELDVQRAVLGCALNVSRRFRNWVDREDCVQEGWNWVYTHPRFMQELTDTTQEGYSLKTAVYRLGRELTWAMERYARQEKATRCGYDPSDEAFYGPESLRIFLPEVEANSYEKPAQNGAEGLPGGNADPAVGGSWMATYVDIKNAWGSPEVSEEDRSWLRLRYVDGLSFRDIANVKQVTESGARRTVLAAGARLLNQVGGFRPHVCSRRCECNDLTWQSEGFGLRRRPGVSDCE